MLAALSITQITSWGVLYYAFPVALADIAADTGWSTTATTAAFSAGLIVSALAGIPVGRWLDHHGPRRVMTAGSLLAVPATPGSRSLRHMRGSSRHGCSPGLAMAAVFYQAAFAALTRWYGPRRVQRLDHLDTRRRAGEHRLRAPHQPLLERDSTGARHTSLLAVVLAVVTVPLHALALTPPWATSPAATTARPGAARRAPQECPSEVLEAWR